MSNEWYSSQKIKAAMVEENVDKELKLLMRNVKTL
jgi:hypothetical protein